MACMVPMWEEYARKGGMGGWNVLRMEVWGLECARKGGMGAGVC